MRQLALASLVALALLGCKKEPTERSGLCGPDETLVHQGILTDSAFNDHSLDLEFQSAYIVGDTLFADFSYPGAYGGEPSGRSTNGETYIRWMPTS